MRCDRAELKSYAAEAYPQEKLEAAVGGSWGISAMRVETLVSSSGEITSRRQAESPASIGDCWLHWGAGKGAPSSDLEPCRTCAIERCVFVVLLGLLMDADLGFSSRQIMCPPECSVQHRNLAAIKVGTRRCYESFAVVGKGVAVVSDEVTTCPMASAQRRLAYILAVERKVHSLCLHVLRTRGRVCGGSTWPALATCARCLGVDVGRLETNLGRSYPTHS